MPNFFFPEYGHVAHQIKWDEAHNNMLANILPLHTPLTPGVELKVNFYPPTRSQKGSGDIAISLASVRR